MSPRAYKMEHREAVTDKTRDRILAAARKLLLAEDFSQFTMESVARAADVSRLTIYYQFKSKAGLLEAVYDYLARRGQMYKLAEVFRHYDPIHMLHEFIATFARFWSSEREVIRRLHGMGAIDSDIGEGLRARNERRRNGLRVIVERYCEIYPPLTPAQEPVAIDMLHMLTSFETFDALAGSARDREEVAEIIRPLAYRAIGFIPKQIS
jgi:AcrR family transcriptional regulator